MVRTLGRSSWLLSLFVLVYGVCGLWGRPTLAQSSDTPQGSKVTNAAGREKEVKFEVISIRPVKPGTSPYDPSPYPFGNSYPSPDGFSSRLNLFQAIMIAYIPPGASDNWGTTKLVNMPDWGSGGNWYDINARVSEEDRNAWSQQGKEHALLRSALRSALEERCKLALEQQPADLPDFKLVLLKSGPKLQASDVEAALPKGVKLASGGVMVSERNGTQARWIFHAASMQDLAEFLSRTSGRAVHDMTNVPGRYDFTLQRSESPSQEQDGMRYNWPLDSLGLDLKPGTYPGFKLIIEHIEKPSLN